MRIPLGPRPGRRLDRMQRRMVDRIVRDTGTPVLFTAPGTRPQVTGTNSTNDVFQIATNSSLTGLDISGGKNGVYGDSVTGITLRDLHVSDADEDGFHLAGDISGTLSGNTANNNGFGFYVRDFNGGTISGNTATSNGDAGFLVGGFGEGFSLSNTATFELNEATDNTNQGYEITGTPASGSGTNTGSGNGSDDSF